MMLLKLKTVIILNQLKIVENPQGKQNIKNLK